MDNPLSRRRSGASAGLSAGELSYVLLAVCRLGITALANGTCLGADLGSHIEIALVGGGRYARSNPGSQQLQVHFCGPTRGRHAHLAVARAVQHARTGHDAYCSAIGVSEAELSVIAAALSGPDVAEFVLDVFRHAVSELRLDPILVGDGVSEALDHVVTARLTPRVPSRDAVARAMVALGSRMNGQLQRRDDSKKAGQRREVRR